jgi:hypothetical protein
MVIHNSWGNNVCEMVGTEEHFDVVQEYHNQACKFPALYWKICVPQYKVHLKKEKLRNQHFILTQSLYKTLNYETP